MVTLFLVLWDTFRKNVNSKGAGKSVMSYEVAQQILGQLATAIEIFTFSYVGINLAIYSWKRSSSELRLSPTKLLFLSQSTTQVLDLPQKKLKMPETLSNSLSGQESLEIGTSFRE